MPENENENSVVIEDNLIKLSKNKVNVSIVYFLSNFENTLINILPKVDEIICLGDFNIDLLNLNSSAIKFLDILNSVGLKTDY